MSKERLEKSDDDDDDEWPRLGAKRLGAKSRNERKKEESVEKGFLFTFIRLSYDE